MQKNSNCHLIGIDLGGTSTKLGLFDSDGTLLFSWAISTRIDDNGGHILEDIACSIRETLAGRGLSLADIAGIGMGIPGLVLSGGYVEVCANLGWKDTNPQEDLSALLDCISVFCENDANIAAFGEMWQGSGKAFRDMVMITLGTGIGGAVILDGKIRAGRECLCGELGHIHIIEDETEPCTCGGVGCLQQAASAPGIIRTAKRLLAEPDAVSTLKDNPEITAKDVIDAAKENDPVASQAVERACRYLGWILSGVTMTIEPEAYIVGGGLSAAGSFLIDKIRHYHDLFTPVVRRKPDFVIAALGNNAGIYGAAGLALSHCKE